MQRQLRLGDILDDYCPRERRVTNHAVVAMVGAEVKQTRCSTCDAEHEYKHAKVPRPRRKDTPAALQAQVLAARPRRPEPALDADAAHDEPVGAVHGDGPDLAESDAAPGDAPDSVSTARAAIPPAADAAEEEEDDAADVPLAAAPRSEPEGPAHRRLIRATLPRLEGQAPATRPAPEFTIRTPATGRPNRFRPRHPGQSGGGRPGQPGNTTRGGAPRGGHGNTGGNTRSPLASHQPRRFEGRKRSK